MLRRLPILLAIAVVVGPAPASHGAEVTERHDDGTAEATVTLDWRDDLAQKRFLLPPAQFALVQGAALHVTASAHQCAGTDGRVVLWVNGAPRETLDPCSRWAHGAASTAVFPLARGWLRAGENHFTFLDDGRSPADHAVRFFVDLDNERGRTLAYTDHGPVVRGELLWSLVMDQAAAVQTLVVRDSDESHEAFLDLDYLDDRAEKLLDVPASAAADARTAQLLVYASSKNCAPHDQVGTQAFAVDGVPVLVFDPCRLWGPEPDWVGVPVPAALVHAGPMRFSFDDSGITWADGGLRFGVDTDNDHGHSTMVGPGAPTTGELMWALEITKA